jgi:hypothetical protein
MTRRDRGIDVVAIVCAVASEGRDFAHSSEQRADLPTVSASCPVSFVAMIRPVSASVARCSFLHARHRLVRCFSQSHSPGPHSRKPVLSTSRCTGSRPPGGRATSSVSALRLIVEWSGTARSSPSRARMDVISPSVWRSARRNTARRVSAVAITRSE